MVRVVSEEVRAYITKGCLGIECDCHWDTQLTLLLKRKKIISKAVYTMIRGLLMNLTRLRLVAHHRTDGNRGVVYTKESFEPIVNSGRATTLIGKRAEGGGKQKPNFCVMPCQVWFSANARRTCSLITRCRAYFSSMRTYFGCLKLRSTLCCQRLVGCTTYSRTVFLRFSLSSNCKVVQTDTLRRA